jgi:membrane protein YqaA with SNARE-associated domain
MQITELVRILAALGAGGLIGWTFGAIQKLALKKNQQRQQTGKLNTGWTVMPGSMRRVGYLVIALLVVQILCPLLFVNGTQWFVSAGVVFGYGWLLFRQLDKQKTGNL